MSEPGAILNRSLAEIRFTPDGRSVQLFLTDSIPPYGTIVLTCENLLVFHLHRTADDAAPYFLGEIKGQPLSGPSQSHILSRLGYSFLNERGDMLTPGWPNSVHLHLEGSLCGDIVCHRCSVREEGPPVTSQSAHPTKRV